jgi:hypothetical protein
VGLLHVRPRAGGDLLEGDAGAFTNAVAVAPDETAFRIRVALFFANLGFDVLEIDDLERLADRQETYHVPQAILDLAASAQTSGEVEFDSYFTYE